MIWIWNQEISSPNFQIFSGIFNEILYVYIFQKYLKSMKSYVYIKHDITYQIKTSFVVFVCQFLLKLLINK